MQTRKFTRAGPLGFPQPEVIEETIVKDGTFVRKVVQTVLVDHKTKGRRVESLTIDEYRKKKKTDPWPPTPTRISLDHDAIRKLLIYLLAHKEFLRLQRSTTYTLLTGASELSELSGEELDSLVNLVRQASLQGKLNSLLDANVLKNLNAAVQQARYKEAIDKLQQMLADPSLSEDDYKKWFNEHNWVFGAEYSGTEASSRVGWASRGDIILRTVDGYLDIVELKLPTHEVLIYDKSHDTFYPSSEVSKAIAQVIKYFQETEDSRLQLEVKENLPFLKPRGRIVIGRSTAWDRKQYDALRRINAALQSVQVLTYDHLFDSAKRLTAYYEHP